ncbi:MAG: sensor histidine kinase [Hormoscilla sp.]
MLRSMEWKLPFPWATRDLTASCLLDWQLSLNSQQQLKQDNLVINGIQYTSPGGVVMLRLERDAHYALIHVEDNGLGISPEEKSQIFDRFYRVNKTRSKNQGGFGLGFSIAGAIAQVHQGAIAVQQKQELTIGLIEQYYTWVPRNAINN